MRGPSEPVIDTSPTPGDEVRTTTCYMCACRCGIRVHLKDGRIRYIEGNPDHPVNRGVLCGKGSAGIMTQYSPARLRAPLLRVGERGAGEFKEISWNEAMEIATGWLRHVRATDPRKLAFFTGRDQSQSLTGFWAAQFGTPNFAAARAAGAPPSGLKLSRPPTGASITGSAMRRPKNGTDLSM